MQQPQYQPRLKSRGLYVILGLFLGGFGVHDFYAERFLPAVLWLLCGLFIAFTWWLILPLLLVPVVGFGIIIELCVVRTDGRGFPFDGYRWEVEAPRQDLPPAPQEPAPKREPMYLMRGGGDC